MVATIRASVQAGPWYLVAIALVTPPTVLAVQEPAVPPSIEVFRQAFVSAVQARDVGRWAELFAEEGVMMSSNGTTTVGRTRFRRLWSRTFEGRTGPNPLSVRIDDVVMRGDLALVRASYGPEGAAPVGQYVWVLERLGDAPWTLKWWIFNRRN